MKSRVMQQKKVESMATIDQVLLGKYQIGRILGRGSFAKVYHARSLSDGTEVAIKVIDKSKVNNASRELHIVREVLAMHRLQHPNIIQIHEVMATKTKIYLVMEYVQGGELFSKISQDGRLPESDACRYFQQLVSALHFCHKNGIAHRDVKPQNLLLDNEGNLKVSDFGLSALPEQLKDGLLQTACGTPAYTAPEVVGRIAYDGAKADAWSCGVILFMLLAGYLPFDHTNLIVMYRKILSKEYQFPSWFSMPVRRVISQLLEPEPETRISIEELMEDDWFKNSFQSSNMDHYHITDDPSFHKDCYPCTSMNAFDIISLSSGLDLSGLFEATKKKEKRFTTRLSTEKSVEMVTKIGTKLGYEVKRISSIGKNGRLKISMEKEMSFLLVEVLEIAPTLVLVELKVINGGVDYFEGLHWEDLRAELDHITVAWHDNCTSLIKY